MPRLSAAALWTLLLLYAAGRISQLWAATLPPLVIVVAQVVPPALFALLHGSILYRLKGILIFTVLCLGVGASFESISLRTGFPFGHYYFTDVMGPKLFQLPFLLVLAYLGIGYASWILALLILGDRGQLGDRSQLSAQVLAVPILASLIMTTWDLSMEAAWATLYRAWIWQNGGAFFGVPIGNFFGWYLTTFSMYLLFALYLRNGPAPARTFSGKYWTSAILLYLICAAGNLLLPLLPTPVIVADAGGRLWLAKDIQSVTVLISGLIMIPLAVLGWLRRIPLVSVP